MNEYDDSDDFKTRWLRSSFESITIHNAAIVIVKELRCDQSAYKPAAWYNLWM